MYGMYDWQWFMHVGNFSTTQNTWMQTLDASIHSCSPGSGCGHAAQGKTTTKDLLWMASPLLSLTLQ